MATKTACPFDFNILGNDMQVVEVSLPPQNTVIAEAGVLNYMESGITFQTCLGDGSHTNKKFLTKLFSASKRAISGESLFLTHFTNIGERIKKVAFAAPYPGKILSIDLSATNNELFCQKDSFLAASFGTEIDIAFTKRLGAGFFGGEGFILQHLKGDGLIFIHAGGTVIEKELNDETVFIDTGSLAAFTTGIDYQIQKAGNLKSVLFGGEGMFLAKLSGTGKVYIQSLPFSRLAARTAQAASTLGGGEVGESSLLGINRMFKSG